MNLHEYQAKELLKKYNVPVQEGIAVDTVMAAEEAYRQIKNDTGNNFAVVKAQIHLGDAVSLWFKKRSVFARSKIYVQVYNVRMFNSSRKPYYKKIPPSGRLYNL